MDLIRYLAATESYREHFGHYPPTPEEQRRAHREALMEEAEEIQQDAEPSLHPPIPRRGKRKYWK